MIKFLFIFSISFFVLSIPIQKRQLFYYLDQWANPYTRPILRQTSAFVRKQLSEIEVLGMRIVGRPEAENSAQTPATVSTSYREVFTPKKVEKLQGKREAKGRASPSDLDRKSEVLEVEHYSETELLQLKAMLKNSDI